MKSEILRQYSNILHLYAVRENYMIKIKRLEERKQGTVGKILHANLTVSLDNGSLISESKFSEGLNVFKKQNKTPKSRGRQSRRMSSQVGCAGTSEKHLTCTVKISEYCIMSSQKTRKKKEKKQTKHI